MDQQPINISSLHVIHMLEILPVAWGAVDAVTVVCSTVWNSEFLSYFRDAEHWPDVHLTAEDWPSSTRREKLANLQSKPDVELTFKIKARRCAVAVLVNFGFSMCSCCGRPIVSISHGPLSEEHFVYPDLSYFNLLFEHHLQAVSLNKRFILKLRPGTAIAISGAWQW